MSLAIHISFDGLSGADGSARFSFGTTTAIASVSGPIAPRPATEHPVRASIDVHVRPLDAVPATPEKHTANALRGVFERACVLTQHPRTAIQIVVQVLSSLGKNEERDVDVEKDVRLAAQINAASLALLNAGSVPMRGVVCTVPVVHSLKPQSVPQIIYSSRGLHRAVYSGCFAFLFGAGPGHESASMPTVTEELDTVMDTEGVNGTVPPAKMIWTNYHARPGEAFSVEELAQAERVALESATVVWVKMKASLSASSAAGGGAS